MARVFTLGACVSIHIHPNQLFRGVGCRVWFGSRSRRDLPSQFRFRAFRTGMKLATFQIFFLPFFPSPTGSWHSCLNKAQTKGLVPTTFYLFYFDRRVGVDFVLLVVVVVVVVELKGLVAECVCKHFVVVAVDFIITLVRARL